MPLRPSALPQGGKGAGGQGSPQLLSPSAPLQGGGAVEGVAERFERGEMDAVTFTSSSTVRNFVEMVGTERARTWLRHVLVASIGPITTRTARDLGIEVGVEAEEYTIPGLVEAIWKYFAAN